MSLNLELDADMYLELPPEIKDSFELPDAEIDDKNERILISPTIVDQKIEQYTKFISQSRSLRSNDQVQIIVPSSNATNIVTVKQLENVVLSQIVQHAHVNDTVEQTIDTGMRMCRHFLNGCVGNPGFELDRCGFKAVLKKILHESWVPESAAQSLTAYVYNYLTNDQNSLKWSTVKDVFEFAMDENTNMLVYIVVSSYVTLLCAPKTGFFGGVYIGYFIDDLSKYITDVVKMVVNMTQQGLEWDGVIVESDKDSPNVIDAMRLSEWFIINIMVLQTGYTGFKIGEKVWKLVYSILKKCNASNALKVIKKEIDTLFESHFRKNIRATKMVSI